MGGGSLVVMHSALRRAAVVPRITNQLAVARQSTSTALAPSDHSYDKPLEKLGDPSKRAFSYLVLGGARFIYASATRLIAMKFIASMSASADVLALASTEVNIGEIEPGAAITVKWRGKPVFVRHRTEAEIAAAVKADKANLVDPQNDADRVKDPAWLVTI